MLHSVWPSECGLHNTLCNQPVQAEEKLCPEHALQPLNSISHPRKATLLHLSLLQSVWEHMSVLVTMIVEYLTPWNGERQPFSWLSTHRTFSKPGPSGNHAVLLPSLSIPIMLSQVDSLDCSHNLPFYSQQPTKAILKVRLENTQVSACSSSKQAFLPGNAVSGGQVSEVLV